MRKSQLMAPLAGFHSHTPMSAASSASAGWMPIESPTVVLIDVMLIRVPCGTGSTRRPGEMEVIALQPRNDPRRCAGFL
jgi:hypothetical protein